MSVSKWVLRSVGKDGRGGRGGGGGVMAATTLLTTPSYAQEKKAEMCHQVMSQEKSKKEKRHCEDVSHATTGISESAVRVIREGEAVLRRALLYSSSHYRSGRFLLAERTAYQDTLKQDEGDDNQQWLWHRLSTETALESGRRSAASTSLTSSSLLPLLIWWAVSYCGGHWQHRLEKGRWGQQLWRTNKLSESKENHFLPRRRTVNTSFLNQQTLHPSPSTLLKSAHTLAFSRFLSFSDKFSLLILISFSPAFSCIFSTFPWSSLGSLLALTAITIASFLKLQQANPDWTSSATGPRPLVTACPGQVGPDVPTSSPLARRLPLPTPPSSTCFPFQLTQLPVNLHRRAASRQQQLNLLLRMQQALRHEAEYFDEKKRLLRAIFNETLAQCADAYRSKNVPKGKCTVNVLLLLLNISTYHFLLVACLA